MSNKEHMRHQSHLSEHILVTQETLAALLEQLVYIDTFMNGQTQQSPNLDIDGQLLMELAAFADDLFVFPDENKSEAEARWNHFDDLPLVGLLVPSLALISAPRPALLALLAGLVNLPKFPVPPGAKSLLELAGLSLNQIDLLLALVAQHQHLLGRLIPQTQVQQPQVPQTSFDFGFSPNPSTESTLTFPVHQPQVSRSLLTNALFTSGVSTPHNLIHPLPLSLEDNGFQGLPMSLELDKRRRNTAALARFRIKKKMKEKQMEERIVDLNNTVKDFEQKITRLEMENKLLRNLIIEKGLQKSEDEVKQLKEKVQRSND